VTSHFRDPIFFIGTRAELIKVAPVIKQLDLSDVEIKILWAGLHSKPTFPKVKRLLVFSLSGRDGDKDTFLDVLLWFLKSLVKTIGCGLSVRISRKRPRMVVVHGDTLCTLLGGLFAKASGAKLVHIEAGLRSGNLWRPFPEEISRRLVSLLTDIHFAPGERETANLGRRRGEIINTLHNTSRDALLDNVEGVQFGDDGYLVVTLHRSELLSNKAQTVAITEKILELSARFEIKWFMGNHEQKALKSLGILDKIIHSDVELLERTSHENFLKTLVRAHCVITDSGGLQTECNDLGIPVIVHRNESEQSNYPNSPCVITKWNLNAIDLFLGELGGDTTLKGLGTEVVAAEIIADRIIQQIRKSSI